MLSDLPTVLHSTSYSVPSDTSSDRTEKREKANKELTIKSNQFNLPIG